MDANSIGNPEPGSVERALDFRFRKLEELVFLPVQWRSGVRTFVSVGDGLFCSIDHKPGGFPLAIRKSKFPAIEIGQFCQIANELHGLVV